jgi:hypothetical protein
VPAWKAPVPSWSLLSHWPGLPAPAASPASSELALLGPSSKSWVAWLAHTGPQIFAAPHSTQNPELQSSASPLQIAEPLPPLWLWGQHSLVKGGNVQCGQRRLQERAVVGTKSMRF